ncbi:hypothetical protein MG293_011203 [Ovis ammon polii]|uniref:Uncharacterized protein n=1 Tax=Ovis ammon polii TaxID=230172 RepID=A0AAD4U5M4_OVIAM|nr:hypothetical protein MG293_011203 [Ovis ammon polii]
MEPDAVQPIDVSKLSSGKEITLVQESSHAECKGFVSSPLKTIPTAVISWKVFGTAMKKVFTYMLHNAAIGMVQTPEDQLMIYFFKRLPQKVKRFLQQKRIHKSKLFVTSPVPRWEDGFQNLQRIWKNGEFSSRYGLGAQAP